MSDIKPQHYVLSDLHLGHTAILGFCRPWFKTIEEHDDYIIQQIKKTVEKNEYLWLLGDVAFTREALFRFKEVECHLGLIAGNHDHFNADTYLRVFNKIKGVDQVRIGEEKAILTHIPVHPEHMARWAYNIHGHLHTYHVGDDRYFNVSCEPMDFTPRRIEEVVTRKQERDDHERKDGPRAEAATNTGVESSG